MFINNIDYQNIHKNYNCLEKNTNVDKNIESNNFLNCINTVLNNISTIQNNVKNNTEKFELNQSDISLNDIMLNLQKSSIALKMAIQIRNKIVTAYQEIMNQQI
ncbi:MAG: flagellar hook-basal body complex protein FliE [Buchnera aphidicola (Pentalonia nigronervosa)]|uniref:Flagellar hook-basal body complex protein FliE n=1 Tax=Buchnera aphidicola (Pentalonia nigronervosa) TaxID=1309793 RepID=A0A7H1AZB0_9GAMM|nr:MAG: flagellar hook-basal body complex protein FliE [Buchnera aphidicola (Pentalonia nigronervosa)]